MREEKITICLAQLEKGKMAPLGKGAEQKWHLLKGGREKLASNKKGTEVKDSVLQRPSNRAIWSVLDNTSRLLVV